MRCSNCGHELDTRKAVLTNPPEALSYPDMEKLRAWAKEKHPWALHPESRLRDLVEACFDHHRAKGNRHADWLATCRTWVRNTQAFGQAGADRSPARRPRQAEVTREPKASPERRAAGSALLEQLVKQKGRR